MHAKSLNRRMVRELVKSGQVRSPALRRALLATPRHLFLTRAYLPIGSAEYPVRAAEPSWRAALLRFVYQGNPVAIRKTDGSAWTSSCSAPSIVAFMLETLAVAPGMKVLEIGTGTGWNAALLSRLAGDTRRVFSMDIQRSVLRDARRHLRAAGIAGARLVAGDARDGFAPGAPYDRILFTTAAPALSRTLLGQLREGGRLVLPFEIPGINTPILRLDKVKGRLLGGFAGHAEFMHMQGQPAAFAFMSERERTLVHKFMASRPRLSPVPWEGRHARDSWSQRYDFLFYLHAVEPARARGVYLGGSNWENAVGLWYRGSSLALITREHLESYGGREAEARLRARYRGWAALGSPAIHDWPVELVRRAPANADGLVGRLQRPGASLLLRLPKQAPA